MTNGILQFFRKTDNSNCFCKIHSLVKFEADIIVDFTITGKFLTALIFCPHLTFI